MLGELTRSWEPLLSLQRSLERAMSRDVFGAATSDRGVFPPISIWKDREEVLITAEIPGVRKEDINIEVKSDLLRIFGDRRPDFDSKEVSVHRRERSVGNFDRTLKLPVVVEADRAKASFEAGVLKIVLPLAETSKTKRILIG